MNLQKKSKPELMQKDFENIVMLYTMKVKDRRRSPMQIFDTSTQAYNI